MKIQWDNGRTDQKSPAWLRWVGFACVILYAILALLWLT